MLYKTKAPVVAMREKRTDILFLFLLWERQKGHKKKRKRQFTTNIFLPHLHQWTAKLWKSTYKLMINTCASTKSGLLIRKKNRFSDAIYVGLRLFFINLAREFIHIRRGFRSLWWQSPAVRYTFIFSSEQSDNSWVFQPGVSQ